MNGYARCSVEGFMEFKYRGEGIVTIWNGMEFKSDFKYEISCFIIEHIEVMKMHQRDGSIEMRYALFLKDRDQQKTFEIGKSYEIRVIK